MNPDPELTFQSGNVDQTTCHLPMNASLLFAQRSDVGRIRSVKLDAGRFHLGGSARPFVAEAVSRTAGWVSRLDMGVMINLTVISLL